MSELPDDTIKHRDLVFSDEPAGQLDRAVALLSELEGVEVERTMETNCLRITYSLLDHSLEGIEHMLATQGIQLEEGPLGQISRKLIFYREDVEYHNLNIRERPVKAREKEVFVKAYDHRLHGDHDDTPPELRDYK